MTAPVPRERVAIEPRCLNRVEAARYVGIGVTMFDDLVREGMMPKPFRIRGRVLWDRLALDAAITDMAHTQESRNPWDDAA